MMLSIQKPENPSIKTTLNVLPCRIQYDGPTKVTKRFWNPCAESEGSRTAYFRGRKLRGRSVKIPPSYQGLVLKATDEKLSQSTSSSIPLPRYDEDDVTESDAEEDAIEPIKVLETASIFEDLFIWGHDQLPTTDDTFVKGIEEWISFAEAIHGNDSTENASANSALSTTKT